MSDTDYRATIVEVFPMRLGGEVLTDVTLEPVESRDFPDPRPNDLLVLPGGEEIQIWAAPKISHPKGAVRFNVQFQAADTQGVTLEEGMTVTLQPK